MIEIEAIAGTAPAHWTAPEPDGDAQLPPPPKTVRETGLEQALLVDLVARTVLTMGKTHLSVLTGRLRLSINVLREVLDFMHAEQLVEVAWRGASEIDVQYQLTGPGKRFAAEALARCRYLGPAPVTLEAYRATVVRQSLRRAPEALRLNADQLAAEFADEPFDAAVRDQVGAALHAGRSLLLYGPSGSGKTVLARKLGRLLSGVVALPYALLVDEQIVQFYDPLLHQAPSALQQRQAGERRSSDARWLLCQRPLVSVGAELSADMLDLRHDAANNVYHAPPHLRANNGIFLVDDLGRQRLAAGALLNRWSGALDSGLDQLSMHGGHKLTVPFDALLVFATNLAPPALLDEAALRRIGYKVHVGPLAEASYRKLLRHQCRVLRIVYDEAAADYLLERLHAPSGRPLLAAYPRELLGRIADFASYSGGAPRLTVPAIDQAWLSLFAGYAAEASDPPRPSALDDVDPVHGAALFAHI